MEYNLPDEMRVDCSGPIRIVTLNRPGERNAINAGMHWGLANVWRQLRADREARVVILTGVGNCFCAGADLEWLPGLQNDEDLREEILDEAAEILFEMVRFPLPLIAAVNGPAVTLGCSVAVMTDILLIADTAYLSDPHVTAGLCAGDGGAAMWPLLANPLRVREYLFTGDKIRPEVAVDIGLASRVVAADKLMDEAMHLAQRLAEQPRYALQDTKKAVNAYLAQALAGAVQAGAAAERLSLTTREHKERFERFQQARKLF